MERSRKKYILAIDQGTTGTRAFIFDQKGAVRGIAYREFSQYYPHPGWVEHDPDEIWASCVFVIKKVIKSTGISARSIAGIGITNQRETTILWHRKTSRPIGRAIVWQCRRTRTICEVLRKKGLEKTIHGKTGLLLDPYFSGTKIKWMLDQKKDLRKKAHGGELCFGTVDSWLIWKLTGAQVHRTDLTNASRTLLLNIRTRRWDKKLLDIFQVPPAILPEVQPSGSIFGSTFRSGCALPDGIPITAVMGDQQSALYGQGCHQKGSIKNTYGTGCFLVLNTGNKLLFSKKGLLSTIACDQLGRPVYALEGSIFMAGAIMQWLRDEVGIIKNAGHSETMISRLKDTAGVYIVPAFTGLGAPYWRSDARGIITGLTRGAGSRHIVRAALEAIAYQTRDVFDLMKDASGLRMSELKVDGGACRNNFLMQFQADILRCRVLRPKMIDTTVKGAALLAGIICNLWSHRKEIKTIHTIDKTFRPSMHAAKRNELYGGWLRAVKQAIPS